MYIPLETIDVWEIAEEFDPSTFFSALPIILKEKDILVIGTYHPSDKIGDWLIQHEVFVDQESAPFSDSCFDLNRREYPRGHAYPLRADNRTMEALSEFASMKGGSVDKDLFFDHLVAYRPEEPPLPLLDFHDAFFGGTLFLSGLFPEKTAQQFARALGAHPERIRNPVL